MRPSFIGSATVLPQVLPRIGRDVLASIALLGAILLAVPAAAQSTAGNVIDDGNYPTGFDCNSLGTAKAKLDCRTVQSNRTPDDDAVPPGTPAISMPGEPNVMPDSSQHGAPP